MSFVALLAEGVDRNYARKNPPNEKSKSPSSRRAWIEIACPGSVSTPPPVALLAEGVDRNLHLCNALALALGRPPRGGRG